jgi:predicted nucleotide-binding protein (sugar kinase/HSP70/actin superfamily)
MLKIIRNVNAYEKNILIPICNMLFRKLLKMLEKKLAIERLQSKVKIDTSDSAIPLENIDIGKGEFSSRYCEKINGRFTLIMENLKTALQ